MTSPAHGSALADPRVPITLADGTEAHFIVTMLTLARIEDEFGSVDAMRTQMNAMDMDKPLFRVLGRIFGLLMDPERTSDETLRVLDLRRLNDYTDALSEAFDKEDNDGDADPTAGTTTTVAASPGMSGSTSAPSPSDAASGSSGA
jgi:hypothetical protein